MTPVTVLKSFAKTEGGLEKYTNRLIRAFADRGHPVTLVTTFPPKTEAPCKVIASMQKPLFSFEKLQKFDYFCVRTLRNNPSKIVLGLDRNRFQTHVRMGNGVHAAYLERRRLTDSAWKQFSYKINPLHQTLLQIEKEGLTSPALQKIFTNSEMVKQDILNYYPVDASKIQVIHNGVEWEELEPCFNDWQTSRNLKLENLNLSSSCYQFLFVGHNYKRKGLDLLLAALALLESKDFHLSVVGKDKNILFYQKLVKDLKLEKNVTFFGQMQVQPFYQMVDALVIPSQYDPFANVTIEALAMGLFVVTSPYNGAKEILSESNGLILPNLTDREVFTSMLAQAMERPKSISSSQLIRNSVKHLNFNSQIDRLIQACL